MKFIELHIKCHNDNEESAKLREMNIETQPAYDYRLLRLEIAHIIGYYPNTNGESFIFLSNGDELSVSETCIEIQKLINA